jgi:hypothetical protein
VPQSTEDNTGDLEGSGSGRRDLLRKAGIGAAVAWTAPLVLSTSPASAGIISVCPACNGQNIVTNGDGSSTVGWNPGLEVVTVDGDLVFRGAPTTNATVSVNQFINVAECAALIAQGGVTIDVSVDLGGEDDFGGSPDQARLIVNSRPPGFGSTTQLFTSGFQTGVPLTTFSATGIPLPTNTEFVQLRLTMRRRGNAPPAGANPILGYADNISVTFNCT